MGTEIMNLNKYDRQAFVRAVMDDVPMINYDELARKKAKETILSFLPAEVQMVYKHYPDYLNTKYIGMPGSLDNFYMPAPDRRVIKDEAPEVWTELEELAAKKTEQGDKREALRMKLTAIIDSCRTLKQAKERLPEFEKYLPAERGVTDTVNLPVANLVAELNAAGWPKSSPAV